MTSKAVQNVSFRFINVKWLSNNNPFHLQIDGNVVRSVQNKEDLYGRVEPQPMHMVIENGILFVGKGGVGDASTTIMATRLPIPDVVEQLERGTGYE